ncbi:hypothetical protein EYR38_001439 [Pleurotus pulmonarius]|nr:hypothetical protein EYR38_001439 [Pleurotus pulmonarius]
MSPTHIVTFLQYSLLAKPYIQSRCLPGAEAPTSLPLPVDELLARCLNWEIDQVSAGWEVFRESVWGEELELRATEHQIQIYTALASDILQSSYRHIFPPTRFYTYPECTARLTEPVTHKATLHTLREGSLTVYTTSLYCRKCYVRYYHNYSVHNASSLRTYYDGVPDVIQVAPHFFIEAALLEFFVAGKVFGCSPIAKNLPSLSTNQRA